MSRAVTPKPPPEKTNKSPPKSKPPTRSSTPALASYTQKGREQQTQQRHAKPSSPSPSLGLGLGLGLGHAVPQQTQNGAAQQERDRSARELEVPSFMKNRRRWASMSSLSTSSEEESIQQFDREHMGLKNKNKGKVKGKGQAVSGGAQDNANPRLNGPRRPAPNNWSGGAAL